MEIQYGLFRVFSPLLPKKSYAGKLDISCAVVQSGRVAGKGWGQSTQGEECEETGRYMLEPMKGGLNLSTAQVLRKSGWYMRHTMPGGQDTSNLSVFSSLGTSN